MYLFFTDAMITIDINNPAYGALLCFTLLILLGLGAGMQPGAPSFFQSAGALLTFGSILGLIVCLIHLVIRAL